jgi:O-antigen/teichoic acid export membrane protein
LNAEPKITLNTDQAKDRESPLPPSKSSLRRRFVSGVSWSVTGTLLDQSSLLLVNIVLANKLAPQLFGEFSLSLNTALTLSAIAQVATSATASRYVAQHRTVNPSRAGRILGFCTLFTFLTGIAASLFLFFLSDWLSTVTLRAPQLSSGLKIMAMYLFVSAMSGYQTGALAGMEGFRSIARLEFIHAIVRIAFAYLGVSLYGLTGALWAVSLSLLVKWFLYHRAIRHEAEKNSIQITYVMQREERNVLLRFSLPAAIAGSTTMPAYWLANSFLAQQPSGLSQFGFFAVALNLNAIVRFVPAIVSSVGGVLVNSYFGQNDKNLLTKTYWTSVYASVAAVGLASLGMFLFSDFILSFFGEAFGSAQQIVNILIGAAFIETVMVSLYQLVYSLGKMWWSYFAIAIPRSLVIVVAALLLIPNGQAVGLAWAYLLGSSTALCATLYFVRKHRSQLNQSIPVQTR